MLFFNIKIREYHFSRIINFWQRQTLRVSRATQKNLLSSVKYLKYVYRPNLKIETIIVKKFKAVGEKSQKTCLGGANLPPPSGTGLMCKKEMTGSLRSNSRLVLTLVFFRKILTPKKFPL